MISGAREDRQGMAACNEAHRRGDTLVVRRLDRLGRSMRHLVNMIEDRKERGIGFRPFSDGLIASKFCIRLDDSGVEQCW